METADLPSIDLIGGDFFVDNDPDDDEREDYNDGPTKINNDGPIRTKELRHIQEDIAATVRPRHQATPPSNLGDPSHGKLKADQWRTCMEFDIPVSLVKLWSEDLQSDSEDDDVQRRKHLLESTMLLATALRWATSHRTSEKHANEYMKNMRAYLATLRKLFPKRNLLPNHHSALFIGEMLLRFGPVHGWWCFPFERVIGLLQQVNTNSKMGTYIPV